MLHIQIGVQNSVSWHIDIMKTFFNIFKHVAGCVQVRIHRLRQIHSDSILSCRHTNPVAVMWYSLLGMMMNFAVRIEFQ